MSKFLVEFLVQIGLDQSVINEKRFDFDASGQGSEGLTGLFSGGLQGRVLRGRSSGTVLRVRFNTFPLSLLKDFLLVGVSKTDPNDFQYLDTSAFSTIHLIEIHTESTIELTTEQNLDLTTIDSFSTSSEGELVETGRV